MKPMSVSSIFFRGAIGALLIQAVALVSAEARPGDRERDRVPSSVAALDTAAHSLVDSYSRSLESHRHKHTSSRAEMRFLQSAKNFETNVHTLRANVESQRGARRAQEDLAIVRRAYGSLSDAAIDIRFSDRVRADLSRVRTLFREVDQNRDYIYAAATPGRGRGHDHDHKHDDRRGDGRRDDDRGGKRLPGVLGKIFGN